MRRRLILALAAAAAPLPAAASESKKGEEPARRYVDLATVGLPVVWKGRLVNYVFVSVRLNLTAAADPIALTAKEPVFRDALVRAAHRTPFTVANDLTRLDEAALRKAMTAEAVRIAGARAIAGAQVLKQSPKRRAGLPKP
jgi:hypothetical protein